MSDLNRRHAVGADSTEARMGTAVQPGPAAAGSTAESTAGATADAAGSAAGATAGHGGATAQTFANHSVPGGARGAQRRARAANLRAAEAVPSSNRARLWRIGGALAIALVIFAIDALTTFDIAVAVLYVVVVLVAAPVCSQRSVLVLCCTLMLLTVAAFVMSHGSAYMPAPVGRCVVSLAAIGITGFLTLKNMAATEVLREQVLLLDLTSDAIVAIDMHHVIGYWNRGAQALYGFTAEEALGRATHELVQTGFPVPLAQIEAQLLRTGRWEGELTQSRRDGSRVDVASRWSLRRDPQGQPMSVLITNNDITQRKRMEREIERQQQEIRAAIDAIPAMVWIASTDGGTMFVNERWSELNLALDESGSNWFEFVHPDDLPQLRQDWLRALESSMAFENESRIRRGDGSYRWMLLRAAPFTSDDGQIVRWYGANTDIEERRRAAEALARSESFLAEAETLSQTGSIGFALPDFNMFWSKQAYRIFEYPESLEPSLERMLARVHPDDHARVATLLQTAATDLRDIDVEYRLRMPGEVLKQVHLVAHAIDTGEAYGYRGALMDVTEARNVQDALHRSLGELAHVTRITTLGELSASIAHEVSQPIAAIMTNAEAGLRWLERDPPQMGEVREALQNMLRDAQRAGGIVQRIRALAKKSVPNRVPFDLNALIEESVVLVQREIGVHAVTLNLQLATGSLTTVGDRVQLQQVVINLMMNAIQAMAGTLGMPRRLTVRSACEVRGVQDGSEVREARVSVTDSGPGIAEADLQRLFQPFFTTREDGMGMGLSICRSIVESHGGRIRAYAREGQGATLSFVLPGCAPDPASSDGIPAGIPA
jgi:PAS domain S-box-containing protein